MNTNYPNGSSLVYYAPILSNGNIGSWTMTSNLPVGGAGMQVIAAKGYLWTFGGIADAYSTAAIYSAPINANGTLGSWSLSPNGLWGGQATFNCGVAYYNDYYYKVGGSSATVITSYGLLNSNGTASAATRGPDLPFSARSSINSLVADNGYLYLLNSYNTTSGPRYAPINGDHTIGTWTSAGTNGSWGTREASFGFISNGEAYSLGNTLSDYKKIAVFPMSDPTTFGIPSFTADMPYASSGYMQTFGSCFANGRAYIVAGETLTPVVAAYTSNVWVSSVSSGASFFAKLACGFNSGVNF
jgi:hypothetical protein